VELRKRPVSEIMRTEVVTLSPDEALDLGQDIMRVGRLRHMPVVQEARLVGMISDRDLLSTTLAKAMDFDGPSLRLFLRSIEVRSVMSRDLVCAAPETSLEEAARLLRDKGIGCLPVVDPERRLLGLVTETDLLAAAYLDGSSP